MGWLNWQKMCLNRGEWDWVSKLYIFNILSFSLFSGLVHRFGVDCNNDLPFSSNMDRICQRTEETCITSNWILKNCLMIYLINMHSCFRRTETFFFWKNINTTQTKGETDDLGITRLHWFLVILSCFKATLVRSPKDTRVLRGRFSPDFAVSFPAEILNGNSRHHFENGNTGTGQFLERDVPESDHFYLRIKSCLTSVYQW